MRKYQNARELHRQVWGELPSQSPFVLFADLADDGNAGVNVRPHSFINVQMATSNKAYFTSGSTERFDHLFKHEYTHVVMTDKANSKDGGWRKFTVNKVVPVSDYPISAIWGYLDTPRWYAPRWYQEGIACFMETWMGEGFGRALGGYDEAYFRTRVKEGKDFYSIVGLETEGNTADTEQGTTSYLYGTRFINYLTYKYGYDKVVEFYNRTEDSETSYAKQFEKVYGKDIFDVWNEWLDYEKEFQSANLKSIAEYPLTKTDNLLESNLGNAAPMIIDEENHVIYAAIAQTGDLAKIVKIKLDESGKNGGKIEKIALIDGSKLTQPAYITYDKKGQRLIWTDRNARYRGLVVYDLKKGKIAGHLKLQRMYDISYDSVHDYLYGLFSNQGSVYLVRYDSQLKEREILYTFPFGISVSDLDVSHDGSKMVCAIQGNDGSHSLVCFNTADFDDAIPRYKTLQKMEDSNLSQFRFSYDDKKLVGFSYYTGVPNIWSYDIESEQLDLLSNVQDGLFAPYLASNGLVYAFEYTSDGMLPVTFEYEELHDANSVEFLGQKAYEENPEIAQLSRVKNALPEISFGEVYDSVTVYHPIKEAKFQGIYPDISGFVDKQAWNNVTPVVGAHMAFYDPISYFSVNLFAGISPWSHNDWKNKFHLSATVKYKTYWTLNAAWNNTSFYDLFGPRRSSRKGYQVSLAYNRQRTIQSPFTIGWGGAVGHYGGMDALPLYQEISIDEGITSFQTANAFVNFGKTTLAAGGIASEQGYKVSANAYSYLAGGKLFPSIDLAGDLGFKLPVGEHNAFWLRGKAGQSFGDDKSSLGNSYFGGFRNNYVDNGDINRFHTTSAMPGFHIDQIPAHSYAKLSEEINFSPIRFNKVGGLNCYPNFIQICLFTNQLMTNYWGTKNLEAATYYNVGAQMNIQMVFFTHMKTTLSVGYARGWGNGLNQGELMVSLKLL